MQPDPMKQALQAQEAELRRALDGEERLPALLALVALYLDVGEDEGAAAWLEQARAQARAQEGAMSPQAGRCHALGARLLLAGDDPAGAAVEAERAVRLLAGEERARAHLLLGQARLSLGEDEAALRALDAAADLAAGLAAERAAGPAAGPAAELVDRPAADALLAEVEQARAQAWLARGDPEQALRHVRARVELVHRLHGPDSLAAADTLLLLASACEVQGDLESASSAMARAVSVLAHVLGPEDPEVTMAAAWMLALQSRMAGPGTGTAVTSDPAPRRTTSWP